MSNITKKDQSNLQAALLGLALDRRADTPLHIQLATALRRLILNGEAAPGTRLPASRQLAGELSVSRTTAVTALDQLVAEGYLAGRRGAGTFVADDLPHLEPPASTGTEGPEPDGAQSVRPFYPAMPDMRAFPHAAWAGHLQAAWRDPDAALLMRSDPLGWPPLREAIAAHLSAWRGIACGAGQVVITSGAAESFALIAPLLPAGGRVHIEDPAFETMRRRFQVAGLDCRSVRVDAEGFDPALAKGEADAAVVTPSRQYPLGMTMPVARRLALLDWAESRDALIVEDDYDSEFRYAGQPLPALASLDGAGRVIYAGSFSKLLSPTLRLGYLVVPAQLLEGVREALARAGTHASLVPQPALARFMQSGEFATHLRRMRRLYARRRLTLLDEITRTMPDCLVPVDEPSGMHLICTPGPRLAGVTDRTVADAAMQAGIDLRALSGYFETRPAMEGFVLGYAAFEEDELRTAVGRLAEVVGRFRSHP